MTTKTVEQLKAEAQAAAEALAQAERAAKAKEQEAKDAERRAIAEAANAKVRARFTVVANALFEALKSEGIAAEVKRGSDYRALPVVQVEGTYIDITEEHTSGGSYWSGRLNGKLRISVGGYGEKISFPQKADGTFNYAKIALEVKGRAERANAQRVAALEVERRSKAGETLAKLLREELKLSEGAIEGSKWVGSYGGKGGHSRTPAAGKVLFSIGTVDATPEQVRIMVEAARKCGIFKTAK